MSVPRCPKCGHLTYSKKFNSCTSEGCSLNHSVERAYGRVWAQNASDDWDRRLDAVVTEFEKLGEGVTPSVTPVTEPSRPTDGSRAAVAAPVVGERVQSKNALRQKAYRDRQKAKAS